MDQQIKPLKQPYAPKQGDTIRITKVHPRDAYTAEHTKWKGREMSVVTPTEMVVTTLPGYFAFEARPLDSEETYIFHALAVERAG